MDEELISQTLLKKYWLVSADMGYGHQRAVNPLRKLSYEDEIIIANTSKYSTAREKTIWKEMLKTYEFMSRAIKTPVIGKIISRLLDSLLYIPQFYPLRDRSNSTYQVRYLKRMIRKGLGSGVIDKVLQSDLPLITSFYISALAADMAGVEQVYCIICDTDLSRAWVPEFASLSRIVYFAPGTIAAQRLHSYGVPEKNILLTGFPLPLKLLGNRKLNTLKSNLKCRLKNLDPEGIFFNLYSHSVAAFLGKDSNEGVNRMDSKNRITITYTVGGAGAQKEIGWQIAQSLADKIAGGEVNLNLIAGTRSELRDYFLKIKKEILLDKDNVQVIWARDTESYFDLFDNCLKSTDILWTKPSELSFYCALGIPIIMTPAIGPQEKCNLRWLREIGAGIKQQDPMETNQWLFDLIRKGRMAEAAWNGFLKARKYGTYNILDFLEKGTFNSSNDPLRR